MGIARTSLGLGHRWDSRDIAGTGTSMGQGHRRDRGITGTSLGHHWNWGIARTSLGLGHRWDRGISGTEAGISLGLEALLGQRHCWDRDIALRV